MLKLQTMVKKLGKKKLNQINLITRTKRRRLWWLKLINQLNQLRSRNKKILLTRQKSLLKRLLKSLLRSKIRSKKTKKLKKMKKYQKLISPSYIKKLPIL